MQQAPGSTQVLVSKEATCLGSLEGSKSRAKLNVEGAGAMQCSSKINCSEQWMSLALFGHLLGTEGAL